MPDQATELIYTSANFYSIANLDTNTYKLTLNEDINWSQITNITSLSYSNTNKVDFYVNDTSDSIIEFDGNGHTITINNLDTSLFYIQNYSTTLKFTLKNVTILLNNTTETSIDIKRGIIMSEPNGNFVIENVILKTENNINPTQNDSIYNSIGYFVTNNSSNFVIKNCINYIDINDTCSGFVGDSCINFYLKDCYNYGNIGKEAAGFFVHKTVSSPSPIPIQGAA